MKLFVRILAMLAVGWAALSSIPPPMNAQVLNRAALVIRHAEGAVQTACITFEEPQISGLNLLYKADLDLVIDVQSGGALVCKIEETGCPASDCWCQCKGGADCIYWSYWHMQEDSWTYSQGGAAVYMLEDGSIDGWSWGPGSVSQADPPPDITFDEVCLAETAHTPTSTPTSTNSPLPIIISPQPTATVGSLANKTQAPPSSTPTATPNSTAEATEITPSTATSAQVALPTQPVTTRPQKIIETPTIQQDNNEVLAAPSPMADVVEPTASIEDQPSPMPSATHVVTAEIVSIAITETPSETANAAERKVGTENTEPEIQRTVVGSGFVMDDEQRQTEFGENKAEVLPERGYDWLPYAGFLVIISGLALLLVWVNRKRNLS
ncbi:MAG: hypothetical protein GWP61_02780 [Chloroflexi bacterium]|nr:hypothetical protein [Chloroflexota bacterium]